jgi:hypothetical protein
VSGALWPPERLRSEPTVLGRPSFSRSPMLALPPPEAYTLFGRRKA